MMLQFWHSSPKKMIYCLLPLSSNISVNIGCRFQECIQSWQLWQLCYLLSQQPAKREKNQQTSHCQQRHTHLCSYTCKGKPWKPSVGSHKLRAGLCFWWIYRAVLVSNVSFSFCEGDSKDIKSVRVKPERVTLTHSITTLFQQFKAV